MSASFHHGTETRRIDGGPVLFIPLMERLLPLSEPPPLAMSMF